MRFKVRGSRFKVRSRRGRRAAGATFALRVMALWIVMAFFVFPLAEAASVWLRWDANPDPDTKGYKVYYGGATRTYTNVVDAGPGQLVRIDGLASNEVSFFALVSYNSLGLETDFSAELATVVPVPAMTNAGLIMIGSIVERAPDLMGPWSALTQWTATVRTTNGQEFFRPRLEIK